MASSALDPKAATTKDWRSLKPPAWLVVLWLVGLAVTALITGAVHNYQSQRIQDRFDNEVLRVVDDLERRFKLPVYGLMGARGVYAASEDVTRAEFLSYVNSRNLDEEFPGVRGMGFIERVQRNDLDTFLASERADGAPDFQIRSLTQAEQPDLYVIKYIEPIERNRSALGLDVGSEPMRREAAERAARTGKPALTGVIQLVQDQLSRPGFLLYVPVYRRGLPLNTAEQRQAALLGLTYSPIVLHELLEPAQASLLNTGLQFNISDKAAAPGSKPLFSVGKVNERAWLRTESPLSIGGPPLVLQAHSTPAFEASANTWLVYALGLAGVVLSSLIVWVLWLQATGRARAEARAQRLTVDLQKLAMVAQRTANSVLMTDAQLRITWVNEGFTRITGYSLEEARGKMPSELLSSGKTDPATLAILRESAQQGVACRVEILNRAKNGREYWVDTEVQPIRNEAGQLTGFIEIALDVTKERETNERLVKAVLDSKAQQKELDLLARVARETSNAVVLTNTEGNIDWVNAGFTRMTGYTLPEVVGRKAGAVLQCPESNPETVAQMREAIADVRPCQFEILNRTKDGRLYWLDLQIQPLYNAEGRHTGFMTIESDVTARVEAERAMRDSEKRFKGLLEVTSDWHWETDADFRFTSFVPSQVGNDQARSQAAIGKRPWEVKGAAPLNGDWTEHIASFERRESYRNFEYRRQLTSGEMRYYESNGFPAYDTFGRFTGYRGTYRDTTAQKQQELRLRNAVRENVALMNALDEGTIYSVGDLQGRILEINDPFVRISGYSRQELLGANHNVLRSAVQPEAFWRDAWATFSAGSVWRGEVCNRAKNGTHYWVDSTIVPFMGEDGLVEKYISIRIDITERKNAQLLVEAQSRRLDNIIRGTNVGTWEWHVPSGHSRFNERWAEMVGYTLEELAPVSIKTWMRLSHPDDEKKSSEALQRHFSGELDYYECESRMRHKDGHWVWVLDRGQLSSREEDGSPGWMYGTHQDITRRKEIEISLRLSQVRMQTLTELSAQWFWEADADDRFTKFSSGDPQRLQQLNGMALGRIRWELNGEPLSTSWEEHKAAIERREVFTDFEYRRLGADSVIQYISISGAPWFNEAGEYVGYIGSGSDITERKDTEVRIAQSEALLDRTAQIAKVGAWRVDIVTGQIEWSAETCRIHEVPVGYEPTIEEAINFYAPEARPVITDLVNKGMQTGESWDVELPCVTAKGRLIWVRALGQVEFQNGKPVALVGGFQDITDSHKAVKELERFSLTIERASDCFYMVDLDDGARMVHVNEASARHFGAKKETIYQWRLPDWDPGFPAEAVPALIEQIKGSQSMVVQTTHRVHGGKVLPVEVSINYFVDDTGNHMCFGWFHDISEREETARLQSEARERAEQASAFKSQFLANMSHEIRTPMNAILGMLKLMHGTGLQPRQLDYVKKTEGAAKSLLGLLNDILDFSKVEAGKMTLDNQPFGLDHLLRDLSVIFSTSVGNKPVEVLFDIDPRVPRELLGDSLRLQQILINLGGNAIKFTAKGEVVLRVRLQALQGEGPEQRARVHFAMQDSGIGIAPENQQKIFTGFSQAEASTTRRFGGTGLGLSICRRLVEMMGGELELHSALGQGSTFSFAVQLPVLDAKPGPAALAAPIQVGAAAMPNTAGLPVLVVDDNPTARELMLSMGQSLGWAVEAADSGEAALALIGERALSGAPYQAVFMDWLMPGLDGWQTSARIRSLPPVNRQAPAASPVIMMVTAHGREMLAKQPDEVQNLIDGYLVKPVTASMLFDAMQNAVPPSDEANHATGKRTASEAMRPLDGMRLLLVEDNAINQEVAETLLSVQGAAVDIAVNGLLGVEAVQAAMKAGKPYHAVLMDMQMPVMDGLTATREIRGFVSSTTLPIIAMTANAMASDREVCLAAGMNDHVGKPFDLDRLIATLLQWTKGQRRNAAAHRSHAPAPSTEHTPFPAVAGIESAVAAVRLNHDVGLFVRLLDLIAANFNDLLQMQTAADVAAGLAAPGARQQLSGRIHKLRGSAGAVGAQEVLNNATAAEAAVSKRAEDEVQCVLALTASLGHLVQGIKDMQAAQQPAGTPQPAASEVAPLDPAALARLISLLSTQDFAALSLFTEMKVSLGAALGAEAAAALGGALQGLDFARALKLLQTVPAP